MTNEPFVRFLAVAPGLRVLEVGSGLGLLAADVAAAAAGVTVIGVETSPEQIAAAIKSPNVTYVRGDAHRLEFPDASFDLVYSRYLLEHVASPETATREMRRVLRSGGRAASCENDISLLRVDPPCPIFDRVWDAFGRYQRTLGGDALIGRRLFRLFRSAGFSTVELSAQPELHWYGSPLFGLWIQNIIGNVESARAGLARSGICDEELIDGAVAELTALGGNPDASALFLWNRAMAR